MNNTDKQPFFIDINKMPSKKELDKQNKNKKPVKTLEEFIKERQAKK